MNSPGTITIEQNKQRREKEKRDQQAKRQEQERQELEELHAWKELENERIAKEQAERRERAERRSADVSAMGASVCASILVALVIVLTNVTALSARVGLATILMIEKK